ncbi:hypothetical protein ACFV0L_00240 [Streptosporangium canum]|uniref:hypothetical protein n=1 Tax=Streptosporangium canum TaxID=324952 RepID=UPI0036A34967
MDLVVVVIVVVVPASIVIVVIVVVVSSPVVVIVVVVVVPASIVVVIVVVVVPASVVIVVVIVVVPASVVVVIVIVVVASLGALLGVVGAPVLRRGAEGCRGGRTGDTGTGGLSRHRHWGDKSRGHHRTGGESMSELRHRRSLRVALDAPGDTRADETPNRHHGRRRHGAEPEFDAS